MGAKWVSVDFKESGEGTGGSLDLKGGHDDGQPWIHLDLPWICGMSLKTDGMTVTLKK